MLRVLLLIILQVPTFASLVMGQCGTIVIERQSDADSFVVNYPDCTSVLNLEVNSDSTDPVVHLDSLYNLESLTTLDLNNATDLISIYGLRNVETIGSILARDLSKLQQGSVFSSLDSVRYILYGRRELFGKPNLDFLDSVKYLQTLVLRNFDSTLKIENENIKYSLERLSLLDFVDTVRLSNFISSLSIEFLTFTSPVDSFAVLLLDNEFGNLSVANMNISSHPSNTDTRATVINTIDTLQIGRLVLKNIDYGLAETSFPSVVTLNSLEMERVYGLRQASQLLPNLASVSSSITMDNLEDFEDCDFLPSALPPDDGSDEIVLTIVNNEKLQECTSEFLCKAAHIYPQKTEIHSNGPNCDLQYLANNCMLSISNLEHESNLWFPNPTAGELFLQKQGTYQAKILATDGRVVHQLTISNGEPVDLSPLPDGVYLIQLTSKDNLANRTVSRIVKY